MKILGTFTARQLCEYYQLDPSELSDEPLAPTDLLLLVEKDDPEGSMFEVQRVIVLQRSDQAEDMPFDLVQGQEVEEC